MIDNAGTGSSSRGFGRARRAFVLGAPLALLLLGIDGRARANGLVVETPGAPSMLCSLAGLEVEVELADLDAAEVTETRRYLMPYIAPVSGAHALRFLRSIPAAAGTEVLELRIAGVTQAGLLLAPPDADAEREALALELYDSAPLRELGSALYVAELSVPAGQLEIEVTLTTRLPLRAFGSMRGIALPLDWHRQPVSQMRVDVNAVTPEPLRALFSPYHALTLDRADVHSARGSYLGSQVCTDFDLVLLLSTGDEPIKLDLLPYRRSPAEEGHFLALLSPPLQVEATAVGPRDIAIALDVSGSMEGEKLQSAKAALGSVLSGLRAQDRIALVSFHSTVSQLSAGVQAASEQTLDSARAYVEGLVAGGGTNIHDAVLAALGALPAERGRPRYVVLITDGIPTEGPTAVEEIVAAASARNEIGARVFSFGIGVDVNTVLLDRLAADSGGAASYIRTGDSIGAAVMGFFQQISDPVLTDPELDFGDMAVSDTHPSVLPDLFAGQELAVLGGFDFDGTTTVTLRGSSRGKPVEHRFEVSLPAQDLDNAYAPRIWALRQVGRLLEAIKQGATDPALYEQVSDVARRFGVVTEYTRLLTDDLGNSELSYVGVPTDAVGALAVDTSTTLSGYASGGSVDAISGSELRYAGDRTLIYREGYYTDTRIEGEPDYIDVTFGSDRYFELARREAAYGAARLLGASPSVRFELLGRAFRVTTSDVEVLPDEGELREPELEPVTGATEVRWLDRAEPGAEPAARAALEPGAEPSQDGDSEAMRARYGCSLSPARARAQGGALWLLLAAAALGYRRKAARAR